MPALHLHFMNKIVNQLQRVRAWAAGDFRCCCAAKASAFEIVTCVCVPSRSKPPPLLLLLPPVTLMNRATHSLLDNTLVLNPQSSHRFGFLSEPCLLNKSHKRARFCLQITTPMSLQQRDDAALAVSRLSKNDDKKKKKKNEKFDLHLQSRTRNRFYSTRK